MGALLYSPRHQGRSEGRAARRGKDAPMKAVEGLTAEEFSRRFAALVERTRGEAANQGSHGCRGCEACRSCMFCEACADCYRCNYCVESRLCSHCTHCRGCAQCHHSAYCVESERCTGSAYLVRCSDCSDCTYCFGCVGLVKKDFHILNERYDRTTYFELAKQLRRALRMR